MRESKLVKAIQDRVKELAKRHPIWIAKIVGGGRQRKGLPDLRVVFYGWSLDIETKAVGNNVSPAQFKAIREIREAGGAAIACWSVIDFDAALWRLLDLSRGFVYCSKCRAPRRRESAESRRRCWTCLRAGVEWKEARIEL